MSQPEDAPRLVRASLRISPDKILSLKWTGQEGEARRDVKKRVTRLPVNHDREGYIYSACDRACRRRLNFKSGRYLDVDHFCGKEDDEGVSSRYFRKTVSKGELIVGSEIRLGCASLLEV